MFNADTYFENCNAKLKLTADNGYKFARVSGFEYLEDILKDIKQPAYLAVDDTDDGVIVREGAGYFLKRVITVFILRRYKIADQADRASKLAETRLIRNKLTARLIKDSNRPELMFLDKTRFPYKEVPGYFAAGTCGIYFFVTIKEPTDLCDKQDDWYD